MYNTKLFCHLSTSAVIATFSHLPTVITIFTGHLISPAAFIQALTLSGTQRIDHFLPLNYVRVYTTHHHLSMANITALPASMTALPPEVLRIIFEHLDDSELRPDIVARLLNRLAFSPEHRGAAAW